METGTLVAKVVLACGELSEVPCSYGDDVIIKLENDSTRLRFVDGDIKLRVEKLERRRDSKWKIQGGRT